MNKNTCPKTTARTIYRNMLAGNGGNGEVTPQDRATAKQNALIEAKEILNKNKRKFNEINPKGVYHITDEFKHIDEVISEIQRF